MSTQKVVAILSYHKLGPPGPDAWDTWYYVSETTFAEHLDTLAAGGWSVVSIDALLRGLSAPETLPARAALLTFDDAYRSVYEYALPLLADRSYPAVVFAPTGFIGADSRFDAGTSEPPEALCSFEELRELNLAGISVQSHGVSHRRFSELTPTEIDEELTRSKDVLEEEIGSSVQLFAFPYGDAGDERVVRPALERCGYRAACLYGGRPFPLPADDLYQLPRLTLGSDTDLARELHRRVWPARP